MNKKLLVSVLLCFFIFSLGVAGKEKPKAIEFIFHTMLVPFEDYWPGYFPEDTTVDTNYSSPLIFVGHVPPSPKSDTILFGSWFVCRFKWTADINRRVRLAYWITLTSPIMPEIEVYAFGNYLIITDKNTLGELPISYQRYPVADKYPIQRDKQFWGIWNNETNSHIEGGEEKSIIINKLMDNGFDVHYQFKGSVQGVEKIFVRWLDAEVTRLSKN